MSEKIKVFVVEYVTYSYYRFDDVIGVTRTKEGVDDIIKGHGAYNVETPVVFDSPENKDDMCLDDRHYYVREFEV